MKIILTERVPNLGTVGDEVLVKDGYARNFLLPTGKALPASGKNAKALQHKRLFLEKQRAVAIDEAKGEAEKVTALELVLKARAGTGGKLFGSITNRDIKAALDEQGFDVDRKSIILGIPVKSLGTFTATVKLHSDVKVEINFRVVASEIVDPNKIPGEEGAEGAEGTDATESAEGAEATEGAEPTEGTEGAGAAEASTGPEGADPTEMEAEAAAPAGDESPGEVSGTEASTETGAETSTATGTETNAEAGAGTVPEEVKESGEGDPGKSE